MCMINYMASQEPLMHIKFSSRNFSNHHKPPEACIFMKKRLQRIYFPVNFAKHLFCRKSVKGCFYLATKVIQSLQYQSQCVKSVPIRSFSGPYFPAFGRNKEIYSLNLRIQPKCEKIRTRKSSILDTFHTVSITSIIWRVVL